MPRSVQVTGSREAANTRTNDSDPQKLTPLWLQTIRSILPGLGVCYAAKSAVSPYNGRMPEQRFYEEDEAEQILRLAASMTSPAGAMSHERLLATAEELGISPEAVESAQQEIASRRAEAAARAEFDLAQRREFFSHVGTFAFVCGMGVLGILFLHLRIGWAVWPLGIWGISIASDIGATFFRNSNSYNEAFEKWSSKRARKARSSAEEVPAAASSDFLIDKYVHRRLDRGRDVSKVDAMRYLREHASLSPPEAREAVEQLMFRNPGLA